MQDKLLFSLGVEEQHTTMAELVESNADISNMHTASFLVLMPQF